MQAVSSPFSSLYVPGMQGKPIIKEIKICQYKKSQLKKLVIIYCNRSNVIIYINFNKFFNISSITCTLVQQQQQQSLQQTNKQTTKSHLQLA